MGGEEFPFKSSKVRKGGWGAGEGKGGCLFSNLKTVVE